MSNIHNNWRKFLTEGSYDESKLLQEVSEDELEYIQTAVDRCRLCSRSWTKSHFSLVDPTLNYISAARTLGETHFARNSILRSNILA